MHFQSVFFFFFFLKKKKKKNGWKCFSFNEEFLKTIKKFYYFIMKYPKFLFSNFSYMDLSYRKRQTCNFTQQIPAPMRAYQFNSSWNQRINWDREKRTQTLNAFLKYLLCGMRRVSTPPKKKIFYESKISTQLPKNVWEHSWRRDTSIFNSSPPF